MRVMSCRRVVLGKKKALNTRSVVWTPTLGIYELPGRRSTREFSEPAWDVSPCFETFDFFLVVFAIADSTIVRLGSRSNKLRKSKIFHFSPFLRSRGSHLVNHAVPLLCAIVGVQLFFHTTPIDFPSISVYTAHLLGECLLQVHNSADMRASLIDENLRGYNLLDLRGQTLSI